MFIALVTVVDGPTRTFGMFANADAASYFVSELPRTLDGYQVRRAEVLDLTDIATMNICPISGDGTYRYFNA